MNSLNDIFVKIISEECSISDYIMDLRKIVGHRLLLQVGASVIVEDGKGRVLLQKRSDNHCWGYAGGSVELDEDVEDAAKRELLEETGLTANSLDFLKDAAKPACGFFLKQHAGFLYSLKSTSNSLSLK